MKTSTRQETDENNEYLTRSGLLHELLHKNQEHLWREDGERFSRNEDGTYTGDNNRLDMPTCFYRYSFSELMNTGSFSVHHPNHSKMRRV